MYPNYITYRHAHHYSDHLLVLHQYKSIQGNGSDGQDRLSDPDRDLIRKI